MRMATISTNGNGENDVTDTQLAPVPTLAQQIRAAAVVLDSDSKGKKKPTYADRATFTALITQKPGLWEVYGDLAQQARLKLFEAVKMPASMRESLEVGMAEMRRDLAGHDAPRLVQLLVENVVTCWLRLQLMEYHYTVNMFSEDGPSMAQGDYWERRLTIAQGRYLRAIDTLARVRRLAIPVQVNIAAAGGQQVNVAGGS